MEDEEEEEDEEEAKATAQSEGSVAKQDSLKYSCTLY